jgi:hypothetical protein
VVAFEANIGYVGNQQWLYMVFIPPMEFWKTSGEAWQVLFLICHAFALYDFEIYEAKNIK